MYIHLRFSAKSACWGPLPIPGKDRLLCLTKRRHQGSGHAPLRALLDGRLDRLGERYVTSCLKTSEGCATSPLEAMEELPLADLFRGLSSSTQQAFCRSVYIHALLATRILSGMEIPAGAGLRNDESPFSQVEVHLYRPSRVSAPKGPLLSGGLICPRPHYPASARKLPPTPVNSFPHFVVSEKV